MPRLPRSPKVTRGSPQPKRGGRQGGVAKGGLLRGVNKRVLLRALPRGTVCMLCTPARARAALVTRAPTLCTRPRHHRAWAAAATCTRIGKDRGGECEGWRRGGDGGGWLLSVKASRGEASTHAWVNIGAGVRVEVRVSEGQSQCRCPSEAPPPLHRWPIPTSVV